MRTCHSETEFSILPRSSAQKLGKCSSCPAPDFQEAPSPVSSENFPRKLRMGRPMRRGHENTAYIFFSIGVWYILSTRMLLHSCALSVDWGTKQSFLVNPFRESCTSTSDRNPGHGLFWGRHLVDTWLTSGRHLGPREAMEFQGTSNHKDWCLSQLKCKSCITILILILVLVLYCVFDGRCHTLSHCFCDARYLSGSDSGSVRAWLRATQLSLAVMFIVIVWWPILTAYR